MPFLTLEKLRMKNPNFISTDTEKVADKIQPQILDKRGILDSLNKIGINGVEQWLKWLPGNPTSWSVRVPLGTPPWAHPRAPFQRWPLVTFPRWPLVTCFQQNSVTSIHDWVTRDGVPACVHTATTLCAALARPTWPGPVSWLRPPTNQEEKPQCNNSTRNWIQQRPRGRESLPSRASRRWQPHQHFESSLGSPWSRRAGKRHLDSWLEKLWDNECVVL